MKAPPGLVGAAALLWAAASGHWVAGAAVALALEAIRVVRARWEFGVQEFERVTDLTSIALTLFLAWQWIGGRNAGEAVLATLSWSPVFLAPVVLMQRSSAQGSVPLSALFWSMRKRAGRPGRSDTTTLDHPYVCLCLLAGACVLARSAWFLPAVLAVAAWALFGARPKPRAAAPWAATLVVAMAAAVGVQAGLASLQEQVEAWVLESLRARLPGHRDLGRAQTAIGEIGTLKLSDDILYRIGPEARPGLRLRDGVFDTFAYDTWFARSATFREVSPEGEFAWRLGDGAPEGGIGISAWMKRGRAVLPLPEGTVRLEGLNVGHVEADGFGTVRVREGPDLIRFRALAAAAPATSVPPAAADLSVPPRLAAVLDTFLAEVGGPAADPAATADAVTRFFHTRFKYTTTLSAPGGSRRTLERFLATERAGHCEYFATAAALVLRRAGIPTLYVTGYIADEWSELEGAYLVRARHGHAWTAAWIGGRWTDVDATPATWLALENEAQPATRSVWDILSWLRFRLSAWAGQEQRDDTPSLWWLAVVVPLAGWVAYGILRRSRRSAPGADAEPVVQDESLPLVPLVGALRRAGIERPRGTTVPRWLRRVAGVFPVASTRLEALAREYERWRFDPALGRRVNATHALSAEAAELAHDIAGRAEGMVPDARPGPTAPPS